MYDISQADLSAEARAALMGRRYPSELLARLDLLGEPALRSSAWLALLQGRRLCRLHSRFAEATELIDYALATFRAQNDREGELWALAEWVVMRYHADDHEAGLADIEPFVKRQLPPYLRAELLFGQFLCLVGLSRVREAVQAGQAALDLLDDVADPWLQRVGRIQMLRNIAAGYHYVGDMCRAVEATERAAELAREHPDTADMRPWCFYELGLAYWRQGRLADATEALDRARRLAETWQHRELWRWAVATQGHVLRDQDRLDAALASYQLANSWGEDPEGPAFIQLRQGRLAEARWSCKAHRSLVSHEDGRSVGNAQLLLGLVELKSGRPAEALALLSDANRLYAESGYRYHQATAQLYRAAAGLALGRSELVEAGLAGYLSYAASEEVLNCTWWLPELIEPLLLTAVRRRIEPDWAQRMLAERFVTHPGAASAQLPAQEATELEIARRMQLSLLPELPPVMPDLDIAALVTPAAEIGGDFVGYFPRGADPDAAVRRELGLAVGDISGKGLGAALLLSGAVVALNTVAAGGALPTRVAEALHTAMLPYTSRSRMTIAFCYTLLSQRQGGWSLRSTGAGAIPPLLRRANGEIIWLETTGFPLGVFGGSSYNEIESALLPGDMLLMLSDGIVEAMNRNREMFGFERLAHTLAAIEPGAEAHRVLTAIVEAVRRHCGEIEPQDDVTLVVVRVLAGSAG
ncbi:MAG TPA: SpoIIE family protein phosphatase [Roseiflexaceae bacterium]|nr:SpoIIE family protein phosphatase [Roseiflexaceae bacterium]